jgi:nitroreductase
MPVLDLSPDELLTTTRSVRRRLDFSRPVEPEVIMQCLEIALQAPTGGNRQGWHFVVVTDTEKCQALGDIYR